ncbi:hypothetical protein, partial [Nocardia asiatica]|uniref:hypothetical protein n=1 Tax=Nocardia asiatica TaxID=209252 RepID=UPI00245546F9
MASRKASLARHNGPSEGGRRKRVPRWRRFLSKCAEFSPWDGRTVVGARSLDGPACRAQLGPPGGPGGQGGGEGGGGAGGGGGW